MRIIRQMIKAGIAPDDIYFILRSESKEAFDAAVFLQKHADQLTKTLALN